VVSIQTVNYQPTRKISVFSFEVTTNARLLVKLLCVCLVVDSVGISKSVSGGLGSLDDLILLR
jgi:hypothetical protein